MSIIIIIAIVLASIVFLVLLIKMGVFSGSASLKDGMRLENQGKYHEALACYDKMFARNNVTPELRWKIANIAIKLNLIPRAQKELSVLISSKNFPSNVNMADVKAVMATCCLHGGNERQALFEIKEAMRINPNIPSLARDLGTIYCHQAQTKKGISYLDKYVQLNPKDQDALKTLAIAYLDLGNTKKAQSIFEHILKIKAVETGEVNYYLGVLYLNDGKVNQALQNFTAVLNKNASQTIISDTHRLIALCYKSKGLIDQAIMNYGKATETAKSNLRDTKNKINMYNYAVLLAKSNKTAKAKEVLSQLIMLDPGFKDTRIALEATNSLLNGKPTNYQYKFIETSPTDGILMRGLLYSKHRFDIEAFEADIDAKLDQTMGANPIQSVKKKSASSGAPAASSSHYTVEAVNQMPVKDFKEIAQKIIGTVGFTIKSDIRFQGDTEYMDGNAVNYVVFQAGTKNPVNKVFSIRRFYEEVPEMNVCTFVDWLEAKGIKSGIYVVTNAFSKGAMATVQKNPNIKFIDQNGLARMLSKVK